MVLISKVVCENSSVTIWEILFNIAIPIIHHKYRGGLVITRGGFIKRPLSLWYAPRGVPRGVNKNVSPEQKPGNDSFLCYAIYCTHYTGTGTGTWTIVFYCAHPVPSLSLSRAVCLSHKLSFDHPALKPLMPILSVSSSL